MVLWAPPPKPYTTRTLSSGLPIPPGCCAKAASTTPIWTPARKSWTMFYVGDSPSLRRHAEANLQRIYREAVEIALAETDLTGRVADLAVPQDIFSRGKKHMAQEGGVEGA